MDNNYKRQVALLLRVLPEIDRFKDFALHGGTAINLFCNDMPRLSVDIDLTWIPYGERQKDIQGIKDALVAINSNLKMRIPNILVKEPVNIDDELKLICTLGGVTIKVEVNTVNRGLTSEPKRFVLCEKAQAEFESFCEIQVVPSGQLYGGKIVAAIDRQHPRDFFDVWKMLAKDDYTPEIHNGFLFCLLSSPKPMHELLNPRLKDQQSTFDNNFSGMTDEPFRYSDFEEIRHKLITKIKTSLTINEKQFLLSFAAGEPQWQYINDYSSYPGIRWKLHNILTLVKKNPAKHSQIQQELEKVLDL